MNKYRFMCKVFKVLCQLLALDYNDWYQTVFEDWELDKLFYRELRRVYWQEGWKTLGRAWVFKRAIKNRPSLPYRFLGWFFQVIGADNYWTWSCTVQDKIDGEKALHPAYMQYLKDWQTCWATYIEVRREQQQ